MAATAETGPSGRTSSSAARSAWIPAPADLRLDAGVHVWRVDLGAVEDSLLDVVSPAERERGAQIADAEGRLSWLRARAVLRSLLGRALERDPRALSFAAGAHGKPALPGVSLHFNLSHSGPLALYALALGTAVGVDVELGRRTLDEAALAARVFGAASARRLQALDAPARRREFLRAWVRHEAAAKCLGVGIAAAEGCVAADPRLSVADLDVGADAAAAVAVVGPARKLRLWRWQG